MTLFGYVFIIAFFAFVSLSVTIGASAFIVDSIEDKPGCLLDRVWNTGVAGYVIFILTLVICLLLFFY